MFTFFLTKKKKIVIISWMTVWLVKKWPIPAAITIKAHMFQISRRINILPLEKYVK